MRLTFAGERMAQRLKFRRDTARVVTAKAVGVHQLGQLDSEEAFFLCRGVKCLEYRRLHVPATIPGGGPGKASETQRPLPAVETVAHPSLAVQRHRPVAIDGEQSELDVSGLLH